MGHWTAPYDIGERWIFELCYQQKLVEIGRITWCTVVWELSTEISRNWPSSSWPIGSVSKVVWFEQYPTIEMYGRNSDANTYRFKHFYRDDSSLQQSRLSSIKVSSSLYIIIFPITKRREGFIRTQYKSNN